MTKDIFKKAFITKAAEGLTLLDAGRSDNDLSKLYVLALDISNHWPLGDVDVILN